MLTPSVKPSLVKSSEPSASPSVNPTWSPSVQPSLLPSSIPSSELSMSLSVNPMLASPINPSAISSFQPSGYSSVTIVSSSILMTFVGISSNDIKSSNQTKAALIGSLSACLIGSPTVSILSADDLAALQRLSINWQSIGLTVRKSSSVKFSMELVVEKLGYASSKALFVLKMLIDKLRNSVDSGSYLTKLRSLSTLLTNISVLPTITTVDEKITYLGIQVPTSRPSVAPNLLTSVPIAFPLPANVTGNALSGTGLSNTSILITATVPSAAVFLVAIIGLIIWRKRIVVGYKKQGKNSSVKSLDGEVGTTDPGNKKLDFLVSAFMNGSSSRPQQVVPLGQTRVGTGAEVRGELRVRVHPDEETKYAENTEYSSDIHRRPFLPSLFYEDSNSAVNESTYEEYDYSSPRTQSESLYPSASYSPDSAHSHQVRAAPASCPSGPRSHDDMSYSRLTRSRLSLHKNLTFAGIAGSYDVSGVNVDGSMKLRSVSACGDVLQSTINSAPIMESDSGSKVNSIAALSTIKQIRLSNVPTQHTLYQTPPRYFNRGIREWETNRFPSPDLKEQGEISTPSEACESLFTVKLNSQQAVGNRNALTDRCDSPYPASESNSSCCSVTSMEVRPPSKVGIYCSPMLCRFLASDTPKVAKIARVTEDQTLNSGSVVFYKKAKTSAFRPAKYISAPERFFVYDSTAHRRHDPYQTPPRHPHRSVFEMENAGINPVPSADEMEQGESLSHVYSTSTHVKHYSVHLPGTINSVTSRTFCEPVSLGRGPQSPRRERNAGNRGTHNAVHELLTVSSNSTSDITAHEAGSTGRGPGSPQRESNASISGLSLYNSPSGSLQSSRDETARQPTDWETFLRSRSSRRNRDASIQGLNNSAVGNVTSPFEKHFRYQREDKIIVNEAGDEAMVASLSSSSSSSSLAARAVPVRLIRDSLGNLSDMLGHFMPGEDTGPSPDGVDGEALSCARVATRSASPWRVITGSPTRPSNDGNADNVSSGNGMESRRSATPVTPSSPPPPSPPPSTSTSSAHARGYSIPSHLQLVNSTPMSTPMPLHITQSREELSAPTLTGRGSPRSRSSDELPNLSGETLNPTASSSQSTALLARVNSLGTLVDAIDHFMIGEVTTEEVMVASPSSSSSSSSSSRAEVVSIEGDDAAGMSASASASIMSSVPEVENDTTTVTDILMEVSSDQTFLDAIDQTMFSMVSSTRFDLATESGVLNSSVPKSSNLVVLEVENEPILSSRSPHIPRRHIHADVSNSVETTSSASANDWLDSVLRSRSPRRNRDTETSANVGNISSVSASEPTVPAYFPSLNPTSRPLNSLQRVPSKDWVHRNHFESSHGDNVSVGGHNGNQQHFRADSDYFTPMRSHAVPEHPVPSLISQTDINKDYSWRSADHNISNEHSQGRMPSGSTLTSVDSSSMKVGPGETANPRISSGVAVRKQNSHSFEDDTSSPLQWESKQVTASLYDSSPVPVVKHYMLPSARHQPHQRPTLSVGWDNEQPRMVKTNERALQNCTNSRKVPVEIDGRRTSTERRGRRLAETGAEVTRTVTRMDFTRSHDDDQPFSADLFSREKDGHMWKFRSGNEVTLRGGISTVSIRGGIS